MMTLSIILIKRMNTHLLHSVVNRCWYLKASSVYCTDWHMYMFVVEVGLAENVLVLVAHSAPLHNFTIH